MNDDQWSQNIATLLVDSLVDAGLIIKAEFSRAVGILAEELLVRCLVEDYPLGATSPKARVTGSSRKSAGPEA